MIATLFGVGSAIIAGTAVLTAARYHDLPDRVPIHFGIDGTANSYGPRPVVWLLVGAQLIVAIAYSALYAAGSPQGMLVMGDCVLAICGWAQIQIISAATSGANRIPMLRFWIFFVAMLAVGVTASHLIK